MILYSLACDGYSNKCVANFIYNFHLFFLAEQGNKTLGGIIVSWHINFKDRKTATLRIHPQIRELVV